MIPIVSIVGYSGSGKTTLIERLIPKLKVKGYRVGTIKHDAHHFEIDHEGKDTWRMTNSGADVVAISSKDKMAMIKTLEAEKNIDEIASWLFSDMDIIITEGYKAFNKPKIEVVRYGEIITSPQNNLIAIVDNTSKDVFLTLEAGLKDILKFNMKDTDRLADFIEESFLKERIISPEVS
jgi:molybdopterin-guanine dinucleotide biosynthesis adapter protein